MYDWDDLRFFLAVAVNGSTLAASRALKVSQATVSRRIALFEEALGVELFARNTAGYTLTARGAALAPLAERVEAAARHFAEVAAAEARRLSGVVRLTTVESAANAWVIPAVAGLHELHPDVQVEIIATDASLDLLHGEADAAIRFGDRPTEEALIARHLTDLQETFYASRSLVAQLGRPENEADLARYPLIVATSEASGRFAAWLKAAVPQGRIVQRVSSLSGVVASLRSGIGAAVLPCMIGDGHKPLVRLLPPIEELATPCWMVTSDQARRQPHIRAVIDCVVAHVERATALASRPSADVLRA